MGMGHVVRGLALADMLKEDFSIMFAIMEPDEHVKQIINSVTTAVIPLPYTNDYNADAVTFCEYLNAGDTVVLDGYNFQTSYQKAIKDRGCKLIAIDDLHAWHHVADAVINHAEVEPSLYSKEEYTKLYSGLDYVLLRKEFLNPDKKARAITSVKKIFISMGAADINNLTMKFTSALQEINGIKEIHLMLGAVNPNLESLEAIINNSASPKVYGYFNITADRLAELLWQCDLSICPASSISLESCAIGIGLITGTTAENQRGILDSLVRHESGISLGDLNILTKEKIKEKIEELCASPEIANRLRKNQSKMIDGRSPERILALIEQCNRSEGLSFRMAEEQDTDLYYSWTNDPLVRTNSYRQEKIAYEDHVKWFHSKLKTPGYFFYLFMSKDNIPAGQVRIVQGDETVIGISIDQAFRGKSLGWQMLIMACDDFFTTHPSEKITAYIKQENASSYATFKKAGFSGEETVMEQGCLSYKLYKKKS